MGVLSKGFSHDAEWVRLTIAAVPEEEVRQIDHLVQRIRPVFLDQITLYDPLELAQGKHPRSTGDWTSMAAAESGSLNHTLRLAALPERRTVWLRLQTTSSHLMRIEALTPQESVHQEFIPGLLNAGLPMRISSLENSPTMGESSMTLPMNGLLITPLAASILRRSAKSALENPIRAGSFVAELRAHCEKICLNPAGYRRRPELSDFWLRSHHTHLPNQSLEFWQARATFRSALQLVLQDAQALGLRS